VSARLLVVLFVATAAPGCGRSGPATAPAIAEPAQLGIGQPATPAEIAAWSIGARPDGRGLPPGLGTVSDGRALYAEKCASCHGATGREGPFDALVGDRPAEGYRLGRRPPGVGAVTIGNYWAEATSLWDYIDRTMPWSSPGTLSSDQVYALTAWLLEQNGLLDGSGTLDRERLLKLRMPGAGRLVLDDRSAGGGVR
jgi:cytochrome c